MTTSTPPIPINKAMQMVSNTRPAPLHRRWLKSLVTKPERISAEISLGLAATSSSLAHVVEEIIDLTAQRYRLVL
jgi:hypothetical protein